LHQNKIYDKINIIIFILLLMTPENLQLSETQWKTNSNKEHLNDPNLNSFVEQNYPEEVEQCTAEKEDCKNETLQETKLETTNLLKEIETMPNTKEVFDKLVQVVLKQYINKLQSPEWVNLNIENIYNDVFSILGNLEESIDFDNIFNWKIDTIKNNFLLPKEKGIKLLSIAIDTTLFSEENNNPEITNEDIENAFLLINSAIWTIIDISQTSTKEEIMQFVIEFKNIPEVKKVLEENNDLNLLITDILPSIANTLDKEDVLNTLNNFLSNTKNDLVLLINHVKPKKSENTEKIFDAKLNIINNIWKLTSDLINPQNTEVFINCTKKIEIIQSNKILTEWFELLNSEKLTPEDRYNLTKQILLWIEIFSNKNITKLEANEYLNKLILTISELGKKIWWEKTGNFIKNLIWLEENPNNEESSDIEIKNSTELAKLLWENKDKIVDAISKYYSWEISNVDDLIGFLIDSWTLTENIKSSWWKLIERLREIINIDLENLIVDIRKEYINNTENEWKDTKEKDEDCNNPEDIECRDDFISKFTIEIQNELKGVIKDKIKSPDNNNLTKEHIIDITKTVIVDFISNNPEEFISFLKDLWINIESKDQEKLILDFTKNILQNQKFLDIINKIISSVWRHLGGSKNIANEIKNLIDESGWDFLNGYLLNNTNDTIDLWVDFLYSRLLNNTENIRLFLQVIEENTNINLDISESNYPILLNIIKTHINQEKLKNFLKNNYDKIISGELNEKDINNLWFELYELIDNKTEFLIKIIDNCESFNNESCDTPEWLTDIDNINTNKAVDLLYMTLEDWSEKKQLQLINIIFEKFNLKHLKQINILWQTLWENILLFLNAINKNDLKYILNSYEKHFLELVNNPEFPKNTQILSNLSVDILWVIDIDLVQEKLKDKNLTKTESSILHITDELKEVLNNENMTDSISIKNMAKKLYELHTLQESWWKATELQAKNIRLYWEKLFDTISELVEKSSPDYLAILLEPEIKNPTENTDKKESEAPNPLLEKFIMSFLSNNKWFALTHAGTLIKWTPEEKSKYLSKYFLDPDNKENFWEAISDFYK